MKVRFAVAALCCLINHSLQAGTTATNVRRVVTLPLATVSHGPAIVTPSPAQTEATADENPYEPIIARNVFHLTSPPVEEPYVPPPPALPAIKLSGFVVTQGQVRALFATAPKDPKEAQVFYDLREGEIDGPLQLVKIDIDKQEADVIDAGMHLQLTMKDNGFASAPPPPNADRATAANLHRIMPPIVPGRRSVTAQ